MTFVAHKIYYISTGRYDLYLQWNDELFFLLIEEMHSKFALILRTAFREGLKERWKFPTFSYPFSMPELKKFLFSILTKIYKIAKETTVNPILTGPPDTTYLLLFRCTTYVPT